MKIITMNEWLEENRFFFTPRKNSNLLFWVKKEFTKYDKLHITCNGQDIEMKEELEYFGSGFRPNVVLVLLIKL